MRAMWVPDYIDDWSAPGFVQECMSLGSAVGIVMNMSNGGYVTPALAMADAVETFLDKAVMVATGMCASSATVIFTAIASPARRVATKRATFLLHPIRLGTQGRLPDAIAEIAYAERLQDMVSGHYLRAGVSAELVEMARTAEVYLSATEAQRYNLISEVR